MVIALSGAHSVSDGKRSHPRLQFIELCRQSENLVMFEHTIRLSCEVFAIDNLVAAFLTPGRWWAKAKLHRIDHDNSLRTSAEIAEAACGTRPAGIWHCWMTQRHKAGLQTIHDSVENEFGERSGVRPPVPHFLYRQADACRSPILSSHDRAKYNKAVALTAGITPLQPLLRPAC